MASKPLLKFFWIAFYENGDALPQFDLETGKENLFKTIDQAQVRSIGWFPFSLEFAKTVNRAEGTLIAVPDTLPSYVVHLQAGQRPIVLRRNFKRYGMQADGTTFLTGEHEIIYMLGWQQTHRGRNIKSIMFIHEDGRVELSEDFEHGRPRWSK